MSTTPLIFSSRSTNCSEELLEHRRVRPPTDTPTFTGLFQPTDTVMPAMPFTASRQRLRSFWLRVVFAAAASG